MRVVDVFRFADGRTILVGIPSERVIDRFPRTAELVIDGISVGTVPLESVEIPRRIQEEDQGLVAVGTRDVIDLNAEFARTHECILVFK